MINEEEQENIINLFKEADAFLQGHFILSSGLHSEYYLQCAKVMSRPEIATKLSEILAQRAKTYLSEHHLKADMIIAPAMGGVVIGYEMGRKLNLPTIFCERVDGKFTLRRGFEIQPGQKLLLVEDVVTTGKSSRETIDCVTSYGGEVIAELALVNRNGQNNPLDPLPLLTLLNLEVKSYSPYNLPEHLKEIPAIKPGSRHL